MTLCEACGCGLINEQESCPNCLRTCPACEIPVVSKKVWSQIQPYQRKMHRENRTLAAVGGYGLCAACHYLDLRDRKRRGDFVKEHPRENVPATCIDCSIPVLPLSKWRKLDKQTRAQHRANKTLRPHLALGRCDVCCRRVRNRKTRPCSRCSRAIVTHYIWDSFTAEQQIDYMAKRSILPGANGLCDECRDEKDNTHDLALTGGSWQLHPRTRVWVWVENEKEIAA